MARSVLFWGSEGQLIFLQPTAGCQFGFANWHGWFRDAGAIQFGIGGDALLGQQAF
jgi:hypothetical protein